MAVLVVLAVACAAEEAVGEPVGEAVLEQAEPSGVSHLSSTRLDGGWSSGNNCSPVPVETRLEPLGPLRQKGSSQVMAQNDKESVGKDIARATGKAAGITGGVIFAIGAAVVVGFIILIAILSSVLG